MSAPQKSECPAATGHIADQSNLSTPIVTPAEKTGKFDLVRDPHFQDLQKRFALRGFAMNASATSSGVYVSRWGLVRFFDTLPDAEAFAVSVGAR